MHLKATVSLNICQNTGLSSFRSATVLVNLLHSQIARRVVRLRSCIFFFFFVPSLKEEHQGVILAEACDAKFWA